MRRDPSRVSFCSLAYKCQVKQLEGRAGQVFLNTLYTSTSFCLSHGAPLVSWHGSHRAQELDVGYLVQDWWRRIFHLPFAEAFGCILCRISCRSLKVGKLLFLLSWAELVLRNVEKLGKCQIAEQCSELHAEFSTDCAVGR